MRFAMSAISLNRKSTPVTSHWCGVFLGLMLILPLATLPLAAQSQASGTQAQPAQGQQAPPEAGGAQGDIGPYAIPKKTEKEVPPAPPPPKPKKIDGLDDYSIRVDVPLVNVDVSVVTKDGQFVPGLRKEMFHISEDGQPQTLSNFAQQGDAPITAVVLIEFASTNNRYLYDALNAAYSFANQLKPQDWVAVEAYDMRPQILVDFTQDKRAILGALNTLRIPGFSERNLFDSLYDVLDRVDRIPGRKYIILISSGQDTFSKITLDHMYKKIKATQNVTIFPVSIGRALRESLDARGYVGPERSLDFLQADNQMNSFAKMTGGKFYNPRFQGELPEDFRDIAANIRNEYVLAYRPANKALDGSYRKIKVELLAPDGKPMKLIDQKGKELKYQLIFRDGYTAKHAVE